jgi:Kef-type K+ transport system membrane component KefB
VLFLVGAIILGQLCAPWLCKAFSKIHTGVGMKFTIAISFALLFAFAAGEIGLAPIVGAFAAGLILDPVYFRHFKNHKMVDEMREVAKDFDESNKQKVNQVIDHYAHKHVEDIIEPLSFFLVPIFFVMTGAGVKLETLFDFKVLVIALGITAVAFVGKIVAGIAAGRGVNKWLIGWGMVPRGEVGLIFAAIGKQLEVISDMVFSVVVIMVILTTLLTPPILTFLLKRMGKKQAS